MRMKIVILMLGLVVLLMSGCISTMLQDKHVAEPDRCKSMGFMGGLQTNGMEYCYNGTISKGEWISINE